MKIVWPWLPISATRFGETRNLRQAAERLGENLTEAKIQLAEFAGGDGMLLGDAKNLLAQRGLKFARSVAEKFCVEMRGRARDAGERDVDTVGGSAGHKAENEHGFGCHRL
jgi:hypothetical protein